MTRQQLLIVAILGVLNLLVLCGGALWFMTMLGSPPAPSAQSVSLATTPSTPPSSPLTKEAQRGDAPSSTPPAATATLVLAPDPILTIILSALERTDAASSYRLQMDSTASGALASGTSSQNVVLLNMAGEAVGADSHYVLKGLALTKLTSDPSKTLETANVAGKSYVKGPLPILGAKESKWYVLPPNQTPFRESPSGLYSLFNARSGPSGFSKAASEKFDGRPCDVYAADKTASVAAFTNLGGASQLSASESDRLQSSIASAEFKIWVCDDGYVHQIRIGFDGADQSKPSQRFNFKLLVHIYDFGSKISLVAPANAVAATPLIDLNVLFAPTATPFRVPTFGLGLPKFTPFATFAFPVNTPFPVFTPFPTFSIPFIQPNPTPKLNPDAPQ